MTWGGRSTVHWIGLYKLKGERTPSYSTVTKGKLPHSRRSLAYTMAERDPPLNSQLLYKHKDALLQRSLPFLVFRFPLFYITYTYFTCWTPTKRLITRTPENPIYFKLIMFYSFTVRRSCTALPCASCLRFIFFTPYSFTSNAENVQFDNTSLLNKVKKCLSKPFVKNKRKMYKYKTLCWYFIINRIYH